MKKILTALMMVGLTYSGAQVSAQDSKGYCGVSQGKVCKGSKNTGYHCYKTGYAQNFKVCKYANGYYICCESPGKGNATHESLQMSTADSYPSFNEANYASSQSYPWNETQESDEVINVSSYEGYYPQKTKIKVCYTGDNVAELNRAPYKGCPSPQSDGPAANNQRNLNVSTPNANAPLAPVSGNKY